MLQEYYAAARLPSFHNAPSGNYFVLVEVKPSFSFRVFVSWQEHPCLAIPFRERHSKVSTEIASWGNKEKTKTLDSARPGMSETEEQDMSVTL